jgi:NAD(P)-dependent dehydrogenase (short-subunit alcohol dehydrogenase family)
LIAGVSEETVERVFAINARGAFFTLQCAGKHVVDTASLIRRMGHRAARA